MQEPCRRLLVVVVRVQVRFEVDMALFLVTYPFWMPQMPRQW